MHLPLLQGAGKCGAGFVGVARCQAGLPEQAPSLGVSRVQLTGAAVIA